MCFKDMGNVVFSKFAARTAALVLALGAACALSSPASAQTIGQTTSNSAYGFSDGQARFAQIVTAPNARLTSFSFYLSGPTLTVVPQVFAWNGTTITGPALYTGSAVAITTPTDYVFNTGSIAVTPTQQYALVLSQGAPGENGAFYSASAGGYAGGDLRYTSSPAGTVFSLTGPLDDARFSATFAPAPGPAPVPTMSEWAMILFGLTLAGGATLYIQRRRSEA